MSMSQQHKNTMFKQRGFSLIEALVAFLILSVGMLGIASLQLISLKSSRTATLRTVAVIKSEEMFERIRNNPVALDPGTVQNYIVSTGGLGTNHGCDDYSGSVVTCNATKIAEYDIYNWKADLKQSMGGPNDNASATASIEVLPATLARPTAVVTITINWLERKQEAKTMEPMSYSASAHICENTTC